MKNNIKIAYCIPSLYYPSGMERVLTLKANYFTEFFGYEIHRPPYYELHPNITIHQLGINYDHLYGTPIYRRILEYFKKQRVFRRRLNECLNEIKPNITISLLRRDINFINKMTDGSIKLGEIHFNKSTSQLYKKINQTFLDETTYM